MTGPAALLLLLAGVCALVVLSFVVHAVVEQYQTRHLNDPEDGRSAWDWDGLGPGVAVLALVGVMLLGGAALLTKSHHLKCERGMQIEYCESVLRR